MGRRNTKDDYDKVLNSVRNILDQIGNDHGLHRVED